MSSGNNHHLSHYPQTAAGLSTRWIIENSSYTTTANHSPRPDSPRLAARMSQSGKLDTYVDCMQEADRKLEAIRREQQQQQQEPNSTDHLSPSTAGGRSTRMMLENASYTTTEAPSPSCSPKPCHSFSATDGHRDAPKTADIHATDREMETRREMRIQQAAIELERRRLVEVESQQLASVNKALRNKGAANPDKIDLMEFEKRGESNRELWEKTSFIVKAPKKNVNTQ